MRFRLSLIYGALFLLFGVQLPYLPVWLDWKGLSEREIALVLAIPLVLRIAFMPLIGFWADRSGDVVGVARSLALGALLFTLPLAIGWEGERLFILVVLMMLCAPSLTPLIETLALAAVRAGQTSYGHVRLWGSLTFIVANLGVGLIIDEFGAGAVAWLLASGCLLTLGALFLVERRPVDREHRANLKPGALVALLRHKVFVLLLIVAGFLQASHAVFYVYGVLHWQSLGYSTSLIGVLWAIGVIAEVLLFMWGRTVLAWSGALGLMSIGAAAGMVRWGVMAFDPALGVLVVLQGAHALTYAASHMGTMHLISRVVPAELAGTAQALLAAFTASVAMSGAIVIAGLLYARTGGFSYMAMAAVSAAGLGGIFVLRRWITPAEDF